MHLVINNGYCLNCKDKSGNTAIHVMVKTLIFDIENCARDASEIVEHLTFQAAKTLDIMLRNGAYLFARNDKKETAFSLLQDYDPFNEEQHLRGIRSVFETFGLFPSLKCLCAMKVKDYRLPYHDIGPQLTTFVNLH